MAAKAGRLEARITLTGSVTADFVDSVGSTTVTWAAGSYYINELIAQTNTDLPRNWLLSISDGEGTVDQATGKCTITTSDTPYTVTFTSSTVRDILGFAGNISSTSSPSVGTKHVYGMWLPGCPAKFTRHGDTDAGTLVTDFRTVVTPTGGVVSLYGNKYRVLDGVRWEGVPMQRVRTFRESVTNESLETFWLMTQLADGGTGVFPVGAPIRLYWDADDDATYRVVYATWPGTFDPNQMIAGWTGRYVIELPRLVVSS